MRNRFTIEDVRAQTYKPRDAWWTVLLVDPLAARLVQVAANYRGITPNRLTFAAFLLGLGSAACFARADYPWLVAGALLFHLAFVVDCMDGKIARLTGSGSAFGVWLDFMFDQLRVVICTIALMGGQYAATGDLRYLAAAAGILILDMLRYLNSWQMGKVRAEMRRTLEERSARQATTLRDELDGPSDRADAGEPDEFADQDGPVVDLNADFRSRFGLFIRIRNVLLRRRIRMHLVSGIEFQMAAFVVGPLTGAVIAVPAVAGALLLAFEVLLVYKLWLTTRTFERKMRRLDKTAAAAGQLRTPDGASVNA